MQAASKRSISNDFRALRRSERPLRSNDTKEQCTAIARKRSIISLAGHEMPIRELSSEDLNHSDGASRMQGRSTFPFYGL